MNKLPEISSGHSYMLLIFIWIRLFEGCRIMEVHPNWKNQESHPTSAGQPG